MADILDRINQYLHYPDYPILNHWFYDIIYLYIHINVIIYAYKCDMYAYKYDI